jgi:hypothetical protein
MYYSVMCSEDADIPAEDLAPADVNPRLEAVFGDLDLMLSNCAAWNVPALDDRVDDPLVSDIPTLTFSGAFDPVTPPAYADLVAASLSNVYVYTFPGVGHGAYDSDCGSTILLQFLADPHTEPNSSCLAEMGITFRLPSTPYDDPFFRVSVPNGWVATPGNDPVRAALIDSATGSRIMIVVTASEASVQDTIQAFVESMAQNDTVEPARVDELPLPNATWTQLIYSFSDGILIVLGTEQNDQVYIVAGLGTSDTLNTVIGALNEIVPSVRFNP